MHNPGRLHKQTDEPLAPAARRLPTNRNDELDACPTPCWQLWLAGGLLAICAGAWLLRADDPFLLSLWGVGLTIIGVALAIVGAGIGLRIWR